MVRDMNGEVAGYRGLVESLAPKFVGRNGAEFDDLVQEGLIFVWQSLERGVTPASIQITNRMKDWVRLLGTQIGQGRGDEGSAVEYTTLLPIEAFMFNNEQGALRGDPIPLPGLDPFA